MRFMILVLWLAIGLVYCKQKEACCDDKESVEEVEDMGENGSAISILETENIDSNGDRNYIIGSIFSKASADLSTDYFNDGLKERIADSLSLGKTIIITGYAFSDEENANSLALSRAETIQKVLELSPLSYSLETIVHQKLFTTNGLFADYQFIELVNTDVKPTRLNGQIVTIEENRRFKIYSESASDSSKLGDATMSKLEEVGQRLSNNFCSVYLNNYYADIAYGESLTYQMEEVLIRSGMSPGRVSRYRKTDDEAQDFIELVIIE